jgi:light-regulated signal transduction histidine kinase (bacteriophytochrome)
VCQDITDRKAAEDEVLRLNADLEQRVADRVKDLEAFQAMLSHDLRAPLSVIAMAAGLLAKDTSITPSAPASKNVERIRRSVGQMTKLVEELLVLARVGNTKLDVAPVDVTALAQEVVQTLKREHPETKPEVAIAPNLTTRGDVALVKTVLENLVGNAWKYSSRAPEPRIEIGKKEEAFFVKDNGAGFDPGEAHRLFLPFERLHKKEEFDGTGVGLAAVKRIIDRHRGRVWAEGQPGKGATFFFSL